MVQNNKIYFYILQFFFSEVSNENFNNDKEDVFLLNFDIFNIFLNIQQQFYNYKTS